MENRGSGGIWRVGETTLWYVELEGVTEGDNKIVAADIPVKHGRSDGERLACGPNVVGAFGVKIPRLAL